MTCRVLVNPLLLQKFRDCVDVDKVDDAENVLSLSTRDSLPVGEKLAAFVIDVLAVLHESEGTFSKGDQASLAWKGEL